MYFAPIGVPPAGSDSALRASQGQSRKKVTTKPTLI